LNLNNRLIMSKLNQKHIEACIDIFKKECKRQKILGLITFIVMLVASLVILYSASFKIAYITISALIYIKFVFDTNKRCDKIIKEFRKETSDLTNETIDTKAKELDS